VKHYTIRKVKLFRCFKGLSKDKKRLLRASSNTGFEDL
jgi:hypothetical protein